MDHLIKDTIGNPSDDIDKDKEYIRKFIEASEKGMILDVTDKHGFNTTDYLSKKCPILYCLIEEKEFHNTFSWQFPQTSVLKNICYDNVLHYDTLKDFEVKEITIGKSNPSQVQDFTKWMKGKIESDLREYPVEHLPFSVCTIDVKEDDYIEYVSRMRKSSKWRHPHPESDSLANRLRHVGQVGGTCGHNNIAFGVYG